MGRSWYPLTPGRAIEDWTTHNTFDVKTTGLHYRMFRREGKFFMRQSLVDPKGRETAVDERELTRVVGSGHHSRTYLVAVGNQLFQAPMCWYTKDAVWDLCPGYEENNDHFTREIDRTCVFCHNARMERLPGKRNAYVEPIPQGIDCERCHGPGRLHVDRWGRGETPTGAGDPAIVNPRRLTAALRMQICFQCHLGDSKSTERVARIDATLEDWRPGRPIAAAMVPFRFSETPPHAFGLSAQVDRMLLSRCFVESQGRLECVTCHNPHVTVYRKDRPPDFFTSKCLGCHAKEACTAPASARLATSPPDDCVRCHMRKGEPSDHRHAEFTDHWIRKRIDEPEKARSALGVEPYLRSDFEALSPAERAFYRGRAASLRAHSVPPAVQKPLWADAESSFREAIGLGFAKPDAWFFLGKALSAQGRYRDAAEAYAAAYAKDPSGHDAAFAHGQSLLMQKRVPDAEHVFEAMIRDHPESAAPLAELDSAVDREGGGYGITLEVRLSTARMRAAGEAPALISRSEFARLYWTMGQMVAHHTSNGCNLRSGDLLGSGTVSGPTPESRGCLLERTWRGSEPLVLSGGESRTFLEDGDEVIFRGYAEAEGQVRIGFGEVRGAIVGS